MSVGGTNSVVAIPFPAAGSTPSRVSAITAPLPSTTSKVGDTTITGLRVTRDPATATLAANAALKDWNEVAKDFTQAEKEAFIAQIKAVENVSAASIEAAPSCYSRPPPPQAPRPKPHPPPSMR